MFWHRFFSGRQRSLPSGVAGGENDEEQNRMTERMAWRDDEEGGRTGSASTSKSTA